jgi:hypothetical protein
VYIWGAVVIGLVAAAICYGAVYLKGVLGYDDSLDAFGVHGVGGFVGAVLTGLFCYTAVNGLGADGYFAMRGQKARITELETKLIPSAGTGGAEQLSKYQDELKKLKETTEKQEKDGKGPFTQLWVQLKASVFSVVFAFALSLGLVALTQAVTRGNFTTDKKSEIEGLDRTEHDEVGFDFGYATQTVSASTVEPRAAASPKGNGRYELAVEGVGTDELMKNWTALCQPGETPPDADFLAVYPHVTTVSGNRFRLRGGDAGVVAGRMQSLLHKLMPGKPITVSRV